MATPTTTSTIAAQGFLLVLRDTTTKNMFDSCMREPVNKSYLAPVSQTNSPVNHDKSTPHPPPPLPLFHTITCNHQRTRNFIVCWSTYKRYDMKRRVRPRPTQHTVNKNTARNTLQKPIDSIKSKLQYSGMTLSPTINLILLIDSTLSGRYFINKNKKGHTRYTRNPPCLNGDTSYAPAGAYRIQVWMPLDFC